MSLKGGKKTGKRSSRAGAEKSSAGLVVGKEAGNAAASVPDRTKGKAKSGIAAAGGAGPRPQRSGGKANAGCRSIDVAAVARLLHWSLELLERQRELLLAIREVVESPSASPGPLKNRPVRR